MKNIILKTLERLPYFTIEAVNQLADGNELAGGTIRTALYRWMKAGEIIHLKNGVYMTRRFFDLHSSDNDFSEAISSIMIQPSYISLEYILQQSGILTDVTYPVTAITKKNTRVIINKMGTYSYRKIRYSLYFGFSLTTYFGISIARASRAKALFDLLIFRPGLDSIGNLWNYLVEDLRLNMDQFSTSDKAEFASIVENSKSKKMYGIFKKMRESKW